ncbi:redoxin domain-containing protein [Tahibacter amnicola]|uniref:Redoxin domain-containing protein n=1 Tax=Tahibacter amnicola TaxID=2976241 RepID=A0ABY6BLZ7_9GAMM|nr:redoxin domain-containing protein [Tahibacter amnicola]UXI70507.1 redoxin domain-containing protein [Tahibacter amnicola]
MMLRLAIPFSLVFLMIPAAQAKVAVGEPAPEFSVVDSQGKTRSLREFKGKMVVLEWNNPECPFVKKHYGSGNIPGQQQAATKDGVIWLTLNSGAVGKQGNVDGKAADAYVAANKGSPTHYLIDKEGTVGHLYGARTTPHMFVIDGAGVIRYMGAIDSVPSADKADLKDATQYVPQALKELAAGKTVSVPSSEPYGCSVKYGS